MNKNNNNIPPTWSLVKLGDVCQILDNKRSPINSSERDVRIKGKPKDKLFPYYGATGQVGLIDDYLLDGEYILLGEDGAPFLERNRPKAYIVNGKIWVNNHAHILFSKNNKFLCYYLNYFDYKDYVTGTTRLKLNQSSMKLIPIIYPPLPEQKKIVGKIEELFSELDGGIAELKKVKEQIKLYRQSVLAAAFSGKLTQLDTGSERLNAIQEVSKAAEPAVEYRNGNLPEGWRLVKLIEIAEVRRGKSKHRPRNDPKLYNGNYPFIQTGEIRGANGGTINSFTQSYNDIGLAQSKLWPKGTLCISIAANIGESAFLGFDACFPDSIVGIIPNKELSNKFINYYFILEKEKISNLAPATAQKNINVNILQNLIIPLPSLIQQTLIVEEIEKRFSEADNLEKAVDEGLAKAESLRQSILKQAFEGRLVS